MILQTHLDTFSGIGGFALAARWAGLETVQFVEIDPFAQKVLRKNFPGVPIHGDITTFDGQSFRGRIDLLTGGFPCQDVSDAGLRAGLEGKRSGLWSELCRLTDEVRPSFLLVENVTGLLRRGMGQVLADLSRIGYDAEWSVVSACTVGAPHTRERVFILCYPESAYDSTRLPRRPTAQTQEGRLPQSQRGYWGDTFPAFCRVADGLPSQLDRLRGLGNAVVPQVAYSILRGIQEAIA